MITLQYLEPGPRLAEISPQAAGTKLQAALDRLPIDNLLVGWDIPAALEDICRETAARAGTKLYRWHPLLTGDGTIYPKDGWRTRNLNGQSLLGFHGLPEFAFVCPNNPATRETILTHVAVLAQSGRYAGIFLDRMRFPSPAADPVNSLTCFCEHCHNSAAEIGLDLADVRQSLIGAEKFSVLNVLFGNKNAAMQNLVAFLDYRQRTITQFIQEVVSIIRSSDLAVGLDCFSPSLTRMVGQNLSTLAPLANWTKLMVYGHAFAPATLPFEFTDLANWLSDQKGIDESHALAKLTELTGFPLSAPRAREAHCALWVSLSGGTLHEKGLPPPKTSLLKLPSGGRFQVIVNSWPGSNWSKYRVFPNSTRPKSKPICVPSKPPEPMVSPSPGIYGICPWSGLNSSARCGCHNDHRSLITDQRSLTSVLAAIPIPPAASRKREAPPWHKKPPVNFRPEFQAARWRHHFRG